MLDWIPVGDSTRIVAMAYDELTEVIYVRFPGGVEWFYANAPRHLWEEFSSPGTSKGQYIHRVLDHHPNGRYAG